MENTNKEDIDVLEANVLLAIYMGYNQIKPYIYGLPVNKANNVLSKYVFVGDNSNSFKFDSDWNWSMEVYKKIHHTEENIHIKDVFNALQEGNKIKFFVELVEVVKYLNGKDK